MIQEIKVRNFLSFKDEVVLSFEATKDKAFEDSQVVEVAPGVRLLRFAMIMGANASGKSNLLESVEFLRQWWFDRPEDVDIETGAYPFKLDSVTKDAPSEIELRFWVDGVKYWYQLSLDTNVVYYEKLYIYRSNQPTLVFSRDYQDEHSVIRFNDAVLKVSQIAQEELQIKCLNNMSFFAARQQVNTALPVIDDVRNWMRTAIMPIINPQKIMFDYALEQMESDADFKRHIIEYLKDSDINICDIRSHETITKIPDELLNMFLSNPGIDKEEKDRMKKERTIKQLDVEFVHRVENERGVEEYTLSEMEQSYGTCRSIGMEAAIFAAVKRNAIINIDEFDASMHNDLILHILTRFLMAKGKSQMLVTTHYTPLLSDVDSLIRKDCVWFIEKGVNGASNLYSLVEFKGLNRLSSIQNAYLNGRFGARPNIVINNNYYIEHTNEVNAHE